jgi:hypothetical protein
MPIEQTPTTTAIQQTVGSGSELPRSFVLNDVRFRLNDFVSGLAIRDSAMRCNTAIRVKADDISTVDRFKRVAK